MMQDDDAEMRDADEDVTGEELSAYEPLAGEEESDGREVFEEDSVAEGAGPVVEERKGEVLPPRPEEGEAVRMGRLREKAKGLPECPGVYLMKDVRGVVIYVGKSRNLRDRVGSYFVPSTDLGIGGEAGAAGICGGLRYAGVRYRRWRRCCGRTG